MLNILSVNLNLYNSALFTLATRKVSTVCAVWNCTDYRSIKFSCFSFLSGILKKMNLISCRFFFSFFLFSAGDCKCVCVCVRTRTSFQHKPVIERESVCVRVQKKLILELMKKNDFLYSIFIVAKDSHCIRDIYIHRCRYEPYQITCKFIKKHQK